MADEVMAPMIKCEVCHAQVRLGEPMVWAVEEPAESCGPTTTEVDRREAAFHESHWPLRTGSWREMSRGDQPA
jgi:hypothetical protein